MFFQKRTYFIFLLTVLAVIPGRSDLHATDPAVSGQNAFALFNKSEQVVEYRDMDGHILSSIHVPDPLYDDENHILPVSYIGEYAVLALKTRGRRKLTTASLLTKDGLISSKELGPALGSYFFAYDLTQNGNLDLVLVRRRGQVTVHYSAFTSQAYEHSFRLRKAAIDQVTLTQYEDQVSLAVLRSRRGQLRNPNARRPLMRADIFPLANPVRAGRIRLPRGTRGELLPLRSGTSLVPEEFLLLNKRPKASLYARVNLEKRQILRGRADKDATITSGAFSTASEKSAILISQSGSISLLGEDMQVLSELNLLNTDSTPDGGNDNGSGSDNGSPDANDPPNQSSPDCNATVPHSLLADIESAFHAQNVLLLLALIDQIKWEEMCSEAAQETNSFLMNLFGYSFAHSENNSGKQFYSASSFSVLGDPALLPAVNRQQIRGCDVIRPSSDGPGGFVYKTGEKDGKVAVLLPSNIYTTNAWLSRRNGRNIEKLHYDGRTNGWRPTFRSKNHQHSYPRQLIVKARVENSYSGPQFYCWVLENSHIRND